MSDFRFSSRISAHLHVTHVRVTHFMMTGFTVALLGLRSFLGEAILSQISRAEGGADDVSPRAEKKRD